MFPIVYKSFGIVLWFCFTIDQSKKFSFVKEPLHVGTEVKKAQKQGRDYTTQRKTNLIQEECPIHLFHTLNGIMEQMQGIVLGYYCFV